MRTSTCYLRSLLISVCIAQLGYAEDPRTLADLARVVAHGDPEAVKVATKQVGAMLNSMDSATLTEQLSELASCMEGADSSLHDRASGLLCALSMLRPKDKNILQQAAPVMIRDLTDNRGQRQENAIVFLGNVEAPLPDSAVAILIQLIDDREHLGIRSNALLLLGDLASRGRRDAFDALLAKANDPSLPQARHEVFDAFGHSKLRDALVIDELIKALESNDKFLIQSAARNLKLIGGKEARAAIPALRRIAGDSEANEDARSAANSAMSALEK